MRPQVVLPQGQKLFAEVDMEFHSSVYRADWPFAKLRPGDTVSVRPQLYWLTSGQILCSLPSQRA
jgi:hypothetical protein